MILKTCFLLFTILSFSCTHNTSSEKNQIEVKNDSIVSEKDTCEILFEEVKRLDKILLTSTVINQQIAEKSIKAFYEFYLNCKTDSLSPIFLLKAGQVSVSIRKYLEAKDIFTKVIDEFPNFKNRGGAMFLLAQLYDDSYILNNESTAKTIYEQIIKEYPNSTFANDAKACIKHIGKSDEELVHEFLKKSK